MLVLLDTTVLVDVIHGFPAVERVRALRRSGDHPCTTAVNVEEVVRGLKPRERERTGRLFEGLLVLDIGMEEGWLAGDWRREYSARGVTLSQSDALIAAASASAGAKLVTGNPKHFPMPEVQVEHWPPRC